MRVGQLKILDETRVTLVVVALVAVALSGLSCSADPLQSALVKALGDEAPGVPPDEYHRAGQACTVCHQKGGVAKGDFSIAGTIFYGPNGDTEGVDNAQVRLVDARNNSVVVRTNCVGNFFVGRTETFDRDGSRIAPWDPIFPVLVTVSKGAVEARMNTLINREGSCAGCHRIPGGLDSVGQVYFDKTAKPPKNLKCPVDPAIPR
jgi:hypothetical protein